MTEAKSSVDSILMSTGVLVRSVEGEFPPAERLPFDMISTYKKTVKKIKEPSVKGQSI